VNNRRVLRNHTICHPNNEETGDVPSIERQNVQTSDGGDTPDGDSLFACDPKQMQNMFPIFVNSTLSIVSSEMHINPTRKYVVRDVADLWIASHGTRDFFVLDPAPYIGSEW